MGISDALKEALSVANRNWPLLLVNLGFCVLSIFALFGFVLLPTVVFLTLKGLGPSDLGDIHSIQTLISESLEVKVLLLCVGLFYLILVATGGFYVYAGALGVLYNSVKEGRDFSLREFFSEANHLFFPLLGYFLVVGLIGIGGLLLLGAFFGVSALLATLLRPLSTVAASVLISLLCIGGTVVALAGGLVFLVLSVYGSVQVKARGRRGFQALREAKSLLLKRPVCFWGYLVGTGVSMVVLFVLNLLGLPFRFIPYGMILSVPYQILATAVQIYLTYWLLSVAIVLGTKAGEDYSSG